MVKPFEANPTVGVQHTLNYQTPSLLQKSLPSTSILNQSIIMAPKTPKSAKRTEKEPLEKDADPKVGEALVLCNGERMSAEASIEFWPEQNRG